MATIALPLVFQPSYSWAGNDGNWSTFPLAVGTPPQRFDVLPSTAAGEIWVPAPEACTIPYPNCTMSRGIESAQGAPSVGFQSNISSTWDQIGIYKLGFETAVFGDADAGLYGQDILAVGDYISGVTNQTVAGIATPNFWLGIIGLGIESPEFDVRPEGIPSLLSSLKAQNMTPSLSYGYSAGAYYRDAPGTLIFGGYDEEAFTPNGLSFPVNFAGAQSLTASVHSIVATGTARGTISMPLDTPLNTSIDSTVSHLWLPETVCDTLAEALGLSYDQDTDLYLVNASSHAELLTLAPEFTFTLAVSDTSNETTNIVLPYAAFDLQAGLPMYNESTSYFPIRRAANASQFILGRAFLQEAYIAVDWERRNFTLGQAIAVPGGVSKNIIPILPPGLVTPSTKTSFGPGIIAGIVIGGIFGVVCLICLMVWLKRRRRSVSEEASPPPAYVDGEQFSDEKAGKYEKQGPVDDVQEMASTERYELQDVQVPHQLMSTAVYELPAHSIGCELPGESKKSAS